MKKRIFLTLFIALSLLLVVGCGGKEPPDFEADYDVIIIGGGMGGLSAGAHLANAGLKVLLLEQHHKVGGCCTNFTRGDFTFEVALHEMAGGGPGKNDRGLYRLLQITGVGDKVKMYELPDFYRSIYPDDIDVRLPNNWEGFDNTLKKLWPEESEGIDNFHSLCSGFYNDLLSLKDLFRYTGFKAFITKAQVPFKQKTFMKWKDKSLQDIVDEFFVDEHLKAVVSQLWVYYGPPVPDCTAAIALAATEAYLSDGVWHITGTSQALSNAYAERIKELGGEVKAGTLVTEIIIEDGLARGVKTEFGDVYTSRYVVCNTDPYQMIFKLIGEENLPKDYVERVKSLRPSNSLLGVYLGLNKDLKALGYNDTEIIYNTSLDSTVVYENMMNADYSEGASTITIYSNYDDPIYAPPGKSVVVLHAYSDYDIWPKDRDEYQKMKEEKAWELINLAAEVIPEISDPKNIEVMEVITPATLFEYTMNYKGIPYGFYVSHEDWERIPNNTPIENVFIGSSWSQIFHSVGQAQLNGWRAARLIMDIEGIK